MNSIRAGRLAVTASMVILGACSGSDAARQDSVTSTMREGGDAGAAPAPTPAPSAPSADSAGAGTWTVSTDGVHGVRIGMSSSEVRAALGLAVAAPAPKGSCEYIDAASLPVRLYFMTESDTLVRIDVRDSTAATREGARVGDSEARIKSLYGSAVRVEPHKYTGPMGHYLIVTPAGDTTRLIVFETDGQRVTTFRVGKRPQVEYVEGCS